MSAEATRVTQWTIVVRGPDGQRDRGSFTSVVIDKEPTPKQIADALAEIAWRIGHDLAQERATRTDEVPQ